MSWAHIQTNGTFEGATDANISHVITSNVTAGSLLVCHVVWTPITATISSLGDGVNTWQIAGTGLALDGSIFQGATYYAMNCAAGATTITVTFSDATPSNKALLCSEYSGIATSGALDVTKTNALTAPGSGANAITSGSTTATSAANELIVALGFDRTNGSQTLSAGTGFIARGAQLDGTFYQLRTEDKNLVSPGDAISTWTTSDGSVSSAIIVSTFKEPSGGSPAGPLINGGQLDAVVYSV